MARPKKNTPPEAPAMLNDHDEAPALKGDSVFIALNHPQGIAFKMPNGRRVEIKGNTAHLRGKEKGVLPVGAYGLTQVGRDDWEFIQETYGGMAIFKNGLIFSADRKADAADEAEERAETRHGREPVDVETTNTEPADLNGAA